MDAKEMLSKYRLVPVVVINDLSDTERLLSSLGAGGLKIAEITFRTACAKDAIKLATEKFPDFLIGAGTVINKIQFCEAISAGAKFIVSPGFSKEVALAAKERNIPYYPGCVTPTEIMEAIDCGIDVVKFFPAGVYGGLKAIDALGAAFPHIKFIPTGGVDNSNLAEYLKNPKIYAVGGSFMMKGDIEGITKESMKIVNNCK